MIKIAAGMEFKNIKAREESKRQGQDPQLIDGEGKGIAGIAGINPD